MHMLMVLMLKVLLLLLENLMSEFRLELMYVSLIVYVRSKPSHLHGFQPLDKLVNNRLVDQ